MSVAKCIKTIPYEAGGVVNQWSPVKLGTGDNQVIVPTAQSDICVGVAVNDSLASGYGVDVAIQGVVLAKVGTGGWVKGEKLGLGSDFVSLITYNPSTHEQVIGIAEEAGSANDVKAVRLLLQVKTA